VPKKNYVNITVFTVLVLAFSLLPVTAANQNSRIIRLGGSTKEYSALITIAQKNNYFKTNNLNIITKQYEYGVLALDALSQDKIDIAVATDFAIVNKLFEDQNLRIIAAIAKIGNIKIFSMKGKGIKVPGDLKGKKIGFTPKTSGEFSLIKYLILNNIPLESVRKVAVPPSQIYNSLLNGKVDAIVSWEPSLLKVRQLLKDRVNIWPAQEDQDFYWLLVTSDSYLKNNAEAINDFLGSLLQSEKFLNENPARTKQILSDKFNMPSEIIDSYWSSVKYNISLEQALLFAMEDQARWILSQERKNVMPNYLKYIYLPALEKLNPEAVTIIR